ncbi:MAG: sensor histidine kinase, partial [Halobaculum sp.]
TAVGGVDPGETGGDTTAARGVVEAPTLDEETVTVSLERDGDERFVELALSPITGDEEEGSILIARDVTRQRERVQKIERQNERLDEFAGVVSHDLRNPLSVIAGRADLLGEELEPADQSHVDAIERSATRMEVIIDDLLTLSRAGEQIEEVETVSLARIAGGAWANVQPDGTELDLRVPDRVWIRADRDRLLNVFENLYRNAREHNDPPLTVRVGVITSDSTTADTAPVTGFYVADDGAGIPESDRAEIFDHGYTTNADGTGFGLSIVAAVVEAHGWEVDVTDSAEGGARFEITGVSVGSRPTDSSSPFGGRVDDAA